MGNAEGTPVNPPTRPSSSSSSQTNASEAQKKALSLIAVEDLTAIHTRLKSKYPSGKLNKEHFIEENVHLQGGRTEFWEDIFNQFNSSGTSEVSIREFITGLALTSEGTVETKLKWAYKMYDVDKSGFLEKNELLQLLNSLLKFNCKKTEQSYARKRADELFKAMDKNRDGKVSFSEFLVVMQNENDINTLFESTIKGYIENEDEGSESNSSPQAFGHQAAGHKGEGKAMLKEKDRVFKHFSQREHDFYIKLQTYPQYTKYFPNFYGSKRIEGADGKQHDYIVLEDLTHGMKQPCIMDLKMGRQTFEPDAPLRKKIEQGTIDNYSTSSTLGFRICGMRVYQTNGTFVLKDKPWGTHVKPADMGKCLMIYLNNSERMRYDVLKVMIAKLKEATAFIETQKVFRFIGSSILFVYDGDSGVNEPPKVTVRMVDFAHTSWHPLTRTASASFVNSNASTSTPLSALSAISSSPSGSSSPSSPEVKRDSTEKHRTQDASELTLRSTKKTSSHSSSHSSSTSSPSSSHSSHRHTSDSKSPSSESSSHRKSNKPTRESLTPRQEKTSRHTRSASSSTSSSVPHHSPASPATSASNTTLDFKLTTPAARNRTTQPAPCILSVISEGVTITEGGSDGANERDEGYAFGLAKLITIMEEKLEESMADGKPHKFEECFFASPTFCQFCAQFIWGITSKQGWSCAVCKYAAHRNCYQFAPNNCK
eukprot:TRINITY_DN8804_c0_g1_i1.p1 TRINITY_DN8804_c0_g1~~TRINITY_DN8804_c0_g1_i1.p1  ORF type:complete len:711 (-),score=150.68 TRINITY_DN8804_c0_g1_i1:291-2423(-)